MKKSGFSKEDDFQAHKDKDWRTVHDIWPNIRAVAGAVGPKGSLGIAGNTGPQGPEGDPGPQGATGSAGVTGPVGVTGTQGVIGESGPTGPTGPGGVTGPQGEIGESGVQGPTGPGGVTGPQGEIGESGATGVVGPTGVSGAQGEIGESGVQGPTGPEGITGPQGDAGPQGITGPQGPAGVTGAQGEAGPSGSTGPSGPTGVQGAQGAAGESGVGAAIIDPDCVLYLPMIEGSGNTVYDKSGEGNDGTLYPTPVPISACDETTDWYGTSLSIDTEDKKEGSGSLKDNVASPEIDAYYNTTYNPAGSWDWSAKKHILFWLKCDRANTAFTYTRLMILDTLGNWRRWDLTFSAGEWTAFKFLLSTGGETSATPPNLALIDYVRIYFKAADTTPFYKKIDYLRVDDRPQWAASAVSGQCLDFDGEDDCVKALDVDALDGNGEHKTVSAWIYQREDDQERVVGVFQAEGSALTQYSLLATDGRRLRIQLRNNAGDYFGDILSTMTFTLNEWHHIAFTYDEIHLIFYIDGVPESHELTGEIRTDPSPALYIGTRGDLAEDEFFNGLIDEVRIYSRALTADEVAFVYKQIYLTGAQGEQGPTGVTGVTGEQGITGPQGDQGTQGITGPQGTQGITGPQGDQGPAGNTGVQGIQGITGPQGDQGTQGVTGVQGTQGVTGVQGDQGTQGVTGVQGVQGITGPQGEQGVQGITGVTGDQGSQGPTGVQGDVGPTGPPGTNWLSTPSAQVRNSNETERTTTSTTYAKVKETKLNEKTGKMRIYFQLRTNDAVNAAFGRVYKNGVAIGTERSTVSETWVAYNQDLGPFAEDDLIQIYAHRASGGVGMTYVRRLYFLYDRAVTTILDVNLNERELATPLPTVGADHVNFSVTNQDP